MEQSTLYKTMFKAFCGGNTQEGYALDVKSAGQIASGVSMESISFKSNSVSVKGDHQATSGLNDAYKGYKNLIGKLSLDNGIDAPSEFSLESIMSKSQITTGFQTFVSGYSQESAKKQLDLKMPSQPDGFDSVVKVGESPRFQNDGFSLESFDGANKEVNVYLSMIISMGAAHQEDLVEAFCPTVPIKAVEGGTYVTVRFPSFVKEYFMNRDNTNLVDQDMARKPVLKHVFDPEIMGQDRTLVVPCWYGADGQTESADAKAWLVDTVKFTNTDRGEAITSGFYKVKTEINIMKLGQSQLDLTRRGVADNTDNLLPGVMVDKLLLKLQPKSASAAALIPVSLATVNGRAFTDPQSGHNKQIALNIVNGIVSIKLGDVKNWQGTAVDFSGCTEVTSKAGYTLAFQITAHGTGNLQTGTFNVNLSEFKLVDIVTESGVSFKGDLANPVIADLAKAFSSLAVASEVVGYSLIAYKANTNLRTRGQLLQSDGYAFFYPVAFRSPVTLQSPISKYTGDDCDFEEVGNAINAIQHQANFIGIRKILEFRNILKETHSLNAFRGYLPSEDYNSALLNPYFKEGTINLADIVDSLKSQDRTDDIRAALINQIREDALKMLAGSNYKVAHDALYGQERKKITVLIGTHYHLGQYICAKNSEDGTYTDTFPLTADMNCKVVTTMNPMFVDTDGSINMLMTFAVTDKIGSIDTVQKLHPGFRLYAPVVTVSVDSVTENGSIKKVTQLIPKYEHHLTMKVMTSYKVTGLQSVLGKVGINFNTVN